MSTTLGSINIPLSHQPSAAHGARAADAKGRFFSGWGAKVWRTLESVGRSRANRELLVVADRWHSTRPELAAELRRCALGGGHA